MLDAARRRIRPFACLLLAGAVASAPLGCATDQAPGVGEEERRLQVDDEAFARLGYRRDWVGFPAISPEGWLRELHTSDRMILAQESGSIVTALDPNTGSIRWQAEVAGPLTRFVSLQVARYRDQPAVLASSETDIYVLELDTGNLIAREDLSGIATSGPVVVGRSAIFGTARGEVMGHTLGVGARTWGFDMDGPVQSGPALFGERVVTAAAQSGEVAFLDAASGSLYGRASMHRGSTAPPAVGDQAVFYASLDQSLYAYEPSSGRQLWRFRTSRPLEWEPVFWQGSVYVQTADQGFVALDASNGQARWNNGRISGGRLIGISDGRLLVYDGREAFLLSPENGSILERTPLGNTSVLQMHPFEEGNLFAMSRGGGVAKLVPRF